MTEPERRILRQLLNHAQRSTIHHHCHRCTRPLTRHPGITGRQARTQYCTDCNHHHNPARTPVTPLARLRNQP